MHRPVTRTVGIIAAAVGLAASGAAAAGAAPGSGAGPARPVIAYVVNEFEGVTPINTATNRPGRLIRLVPAGGGQHDSLTSIGITPNGRTAYVLDVSDPGFLTPISTVTNKPGPAIETLAMSQPIAIAPNGKTLYLSDENGVIPINTATNKPGPPIRVACCSGSGCCGNGIVAITPNGRTGYALIGDTLTPFSTATNKPGRPIKVGFDPMAIAITP
jgi:hypothetical protein